MRRAQASEVRRAGVVGAGIEARRLSPRSRRVGGETNKAQGEGRNRGEIPGRNTERDGYEGTVIFRRRFGRNSNSGAITH